MLGGGNSAPDLYTVGPDGLEYGFIEWQFVGGGELGLSSEQPLHFFEVMSELVPLGENVFMPGLSSVVVEAEIFHFIGLKKLPGNRWVTVCGEYCIIGEGGYENSR
jgi:hypothetical protein